MKILYTAFNGKTNSSKCLLDLINSKNKLYLTNSFLTSTKELEEHLKNTSYDLIISFGQAPINKDTIKLETIATNETERLKTNYDYKELIKKLESLYQVEISNNAGNYLCNNIYYYGLKYIKEKKLKTNMLFIHIPKLNNISDINKLAEIFNK